MHDTNEQKSGQAETIEKRRKPVKLMNDKELVAALNAFKRGLASELRPSLTDLAKDIDVNVSLGNALPSTGYVRKTFRENPIVPKEAVRCWEWIGPKDVEDVHGRVLKAYFDEYNNEKNRLRAEKNRIENGISVEVEIRNLQVQIEAASNRIAALESERVCAE
jgi:hypothetical protein